MIEINTLTGNKYSFDPETSRIFKDGILMTSVQVEPVYSKLSEEELPTFSGILLKEINSILSLSGKINPVITDINLVQ